MAKSARRFILIGAVVGAVSVIGLAAVSAQQRQLGAGNLSGGIAIDFRALDSSGQPVTNLQASDITVKIAGKARTVSALEYVKADGGGAAGATASAAPPPFATNAGTGKGRSLIIIIDNESLRVGTERTIRDSVNQVLDSLSADDHVSLYVAPHDTVGLSGGTPAAAKAALANVAGIKPANVSDDDVACRSRDSLVMMRGLMDQLAGSDTPTSVLYIASTLSLPNASASMASNSGKSAPSLKCEVTVDHYQSLASAVAAARINMFVAQGDDMIAGRDNGLENLAGTSSGGSVIRAQGNGLARVTSEAAGYYVATIAADPGDRPGAVQKLELKVTREGVTTRARNDVALMSRGGKATRAGAANAKEMVSSTAPFTDLQLRVAAVTSRGKDGKMTILTMTEPVDSTAKITELTAAIFPVGSPKATFAQSAQGPALGARPIPIALAGDPGKYRLRVAAVDDKGRGGAVDYDINADLTTAGPLKLGSILLVAPRGESNYAPQLQFSDDEIAMQVDLYGQITGQVSAKIEVASSPDGPALITVQPGGQGTSEPDHFILSATKIGIAKLAPGDYVIRVIVQLEGQPEGRVTRTLRKIAK